MVMRHMRMLKLCGGTKAAPGPALVERVNIKRPESFLASAGFCDLAAVGTDLFGGLVLVLFHDFSHLSISFGYRKFCPVPLVCRCPIARWLLCRGGKSSAKAGLHRTDHTPARR